MPQTGTFVPAEASRSGVVCRYFPRVEASDNLARGE